jgi:hypothetical protein
VTGAELLLAKINYFLGRPENWRSNIATYRKVRYAGLYPGIDAVFYTEPSAGAPLEFDVIAAPHAKPQDVRLILTAVKSASIRILLTGDLTISAGGTTMLFQKPSAWQEDTSGVKQSVEAAFLQHSTYLGGCAYENANGLVLDGHANVYLTGQTRSPDFPLVNPVVATQPGNYDAFLAALDSTGSRLIFSTYLGGKANDIPRAIAIDRRGDIYVAGSTQSLDFPTTPGAFQPACAAPPGAPFCGGDAFVTKIDRLGSRLLYSTYLGGAGSDGAMGLAVDFRGHAYITGGTSSRYLLPILFDILWRFRIRRRE